MRSRRTSFFKAAFLLNRDWLVSTLRAGLFGRSHYQVETLAEKLQQLLTRAEPQSHAGINFLNPAFELALRWPRIRSQLNYEGSAHDGRLAERNWKM